MILLGLAIFAGLSLNLILQFALGAGLAGKAKAVPLSQILILFISVLFLWIIFTYILNFLLWEIMGYLLFFPFSALVCLGLEYLETRFFPERHSFRLFSSITAYGGLVPASLILCVHLCVTVVDALFLSFFFALGCLLAIVIVKEINRRTTLESIPKFLRGIPLAFISMGLLSMTFGAVAWICYRILYGL
jgi:electron transport complex protein RnfA